MIELTDINSKMNLNNGTQIPCVGYGTFRTPADVAEKAVADAIKVGYRHIDTAAVYGNEEAVGKGIKDSGIDRKDLFVNCGTIIEVMNRQRKPFKKLWIAYKWITLTST